MKIVNYKVQRRTLLRWFTVQEDTDLRKAVQIAKHFRDSQPDRKWRVLPIFENGWRLWAHWGALLPLRLLSLVFLVVAMIATWPAEALVKLEKWADRTLNRWLSVDENE